MKSLLRHIKILLLSLLMCYSTLCLGQKNDYIWLSGYDSQEPDTFQGFREGGTKMDFNHTQVMVSFDSIAMNFDYTNTSYCTDSGDLLFYTNGIYIANASNEMIANSDSLNPGWYQYDYDPEMPIGGYRAVQGIIALPDPKNENYYYLIHSLSDSVPGSGQTQIYCSKIQSTYLDMSANNGQGLVVYKNQPILTGTFGTDLTAVRHGNGRDWWMLVQKRNTNCFYQVLLDSSGIHVVDSTCLGPSTSQLCVSNSCFTPDGSKFVYLNSVGLEICDFDRCTGNLSNAIFLPLPILIDSVLVKNGVAVSSNSRYLYVSITLHIYQFDLWSDDIFGSIDTIANYDGWYFDNPIIAGTINWPQLAPDGKIYITCGNSNPVFHVINSPDLKGDSCDFVEHGFQLATLCNGVPNFPNYRLGALSQSQCDSLSTATQNTRDTKEQIIKIFPNPANDVTTVDYGFTDWNKGPANLDITNELGQQIYTQPLPMYSGYQRVDISRFATGMYTVAVKRNGAVVASQKLVKE